MLLLRAVFFALLLPGTVTVLIPFWLVASEIRPDMQSPYSTLRYLGVPLIGVGAFALIWSIWNFYSKGKGTLAPADPPKHLVLEGLYRYVRNPMYVGVLWILIGECILFLSVRLAVEATIFLILSFLFVKYYEEPVLLRQFGAEYQEYLRSVGRWFPRNLFRAT